MSASPAGNLVAVDNIVYSISDATESLVLATRDSSVRTTAFRPDGKVVACGLEDGSIAFWPTTLGNASTPVPSLTGVVTGLSISPDEGCWPPCRRKAPSASTTSPTPVASGPAPQQKVGSDVKAVSFSPDGRFLVLTAENRVRFLHPDTLKPIADLGVSGQVMSAFRRDNRILLLLDSVGVHRFATTTGREIQPVISGKFKDFSLSPDGKQLASWSQFNVGGRHHFIEAQRVWSLATGLQVAWEEKGREPSDGLASGPPKGDRSSWFRNPHDGPLRNSRVRRAPTVF
jgi:WD40 repeat protein